MKRAFFSGEFEEVVLLAVAILDEGAYGVNFTHQQTGQHQKAGKDYGQTNYMERWNNTIRYWLRRLTCKTLSFSKSDFFNELVIRLFNVRYNFSK
jgi:hypothetical protein